MPRIGVISGLKSEIAALEGAWSGGAFAFFAAGGSAERAAEAARRMARDGAKLLMSVGVAGGLDPSLACGDAVLASQVIAPDGRAYPADEAWRKRLAAPLSKGARWNDSALLGSDRPILGVADKAWLRRKSRAVAVDMESHGVARAAAELKLPFVALRVIADPAGRAVPQAALAGMKPDGSLDPVAVLLRLAPRPWTLPSLLRLAVENRQAHRALSRVALAVGGVLVG